MAWPHRLAWGTGRADRVLLRAPEGPRSTRRELPEGDRTPPPRPRAGPPCEVEEHTKT
ncbi:hypothetical protein [Streptosporangium saharense]|uniref:hypothetical protein n=1 Tax=Streptosporangium saharense TaxID=1706840 RepID=UPI0033338E08